MHSMGTATIEIKTGINTLLEGRLTTTPDFIIVNRTVEGNKDAVLIFMITL